MPRDYERFDGDEYRGQPYPAPEPRGITVLDGFRFAVGFMTGLIVFWIALLLIFGIAANLAGRL